MEQMETVITRLAEIEGAAVRLEEMAAEQKKEIAAEYERKTEAFDQEIDEQTEDRLELLKARLTREARENLIKMRKNTEEELAAMEQEYEQNHKKLAEDLLKQMLGE